MFTETITRQENMTQQDRSFDKAVLNSVKVIQSQVVINQKKRQNAEFFNKLMMNNFPVPSRKICKRSIETESTTTCSFSAGDNFDSNTCSFSSGDNFDFETSSVMSFGSTRSFGSNSSDIKVTSEFKKSNSSECGSIKLNCVGPKSAQLLYCMNLFQMQMKFKWTPAMEHEFLKLSQFMLDFFSANSDSLKNQHAESIAAAICLLIGSRIGISKKDFLDAMKPMKKNMLSKVDKIKKSTCYIQMKKAFKDVITC